MGDEPDMATAARPAGGPATTTERPSASRQGALLYIPGASEGTVQWRAQSMQLVNWGGFEGGTRFDFNPGATLISGASGSGKSTLLDAYIALMMPSDTPFNGASNDAVTGRARGAEQRNLLSYLRGQTDTTTDASGRAKAKVLRGESTATWGAVAMTFVNDHGHLFTALRVYFVPTRATRTGEITMRMATYDGTLNLPDLSRCAESTFAPKALKAAFPGLRTHDSYASFASTLYARLGIGANGDGDKALRLLVRIQSGHQIRTVDELYKQMVLERPATFAAADRAVQHFDELEAAYLEMQAAQAKVDLLSGIHERHAELVAARAEIEQIDTFGLTVPGDSPLTLWSLRTERALLDAAVEANRAGHAETTGDLRDASRVEKELDGELQAARREHEDSGGATLRRLGDYIETAESEVRARQLARAVLGDSTVALDVDLDTADGFAAAQQAAAAFLADYPQAYGKLREARDVLVRSQGPLMGRKTQVRAELESFARRAGLVPVALDEMRRQVAAAAGFDPADLPFLAELIDVAPEHARWRTAIETVLGASARTLLVPADRLEAFSAAIDPLRLRGRITFEGVPTHLPFTAPQDAARVAGKLVFADSPFRGWVAAHVTDPGRNALCVTDPADLAGPGYRVTMAGQTRRGSRGSHGRSDARNIIGFSNAEAVEELEREQAEIEGELDGLGGQILELEGQAAHLSALRDAHQAVANTAWADIDVPAAKSRVRDLTAERDRLLAADDKLRVLEERITSLQERLGEATRSRILAEDRAGKLETEHEKLVDRQDAVSERAERIEDAQRVVLTGEQCERLDSEFAAAAAPGDPGDLDDFEANLGRLHARLKATLEAATATARRASEDLVRTFTAYQAKWEDPNLGRSVESYPDYAQILDTTVATGLHERRSEWRRRLTEWSGQDLVPLAGAMDAAVEDIQDRLVPINAILAGLPFGASRDRLQIKLRQLAPEHVTVFRRELRELSSAATRELPEDRMEARFKALQAFMAQIRPAEDPRASTDGGDRRRLLDVRRHVEITAERHAPDGTLLSVHSSLGGKSGGESQELVAFIVGAALRFRLGDEERARPRFAPVFLDEGFVKSDAEFAGRAVQAWKGLGFQLIVGAPLDKVSALEPHMDDLLAITKNVDTHYSFVDRIADAPKGAVAQAAAAAEGAAAGTSW